MSLFVACLLSPPLSGWLSLSPFLFSLSLPFLFLCLSPLLLSSHPHSISMSLLVISHLPLSRPEHHFFHSLPDCQDAKPADIRPEKDTPARIQSPSTSKRRPPATTTPVTLQIQQYPAGPQYTTRQLQYPPQYAPQYAARSAEFHKQ